MQKTTKSSRTGKPHPTRQPIVRSDLAAVVAIASKVRAKRIELQLTQADLAGLSNTGLRFIVDLEHAKPTIALGKLVHVLLALGLTLHVSPIQSSG